MRSTMRQAAIVRSIAALTLGGAGVVLGACQLVGGIGDRTLAEQSAGDDGASPLDSSLAEASSGGSSGSADGGSDSTVDAPAGDAAPGCLTNAECTQLATSGKLPEPGPTDAGDAGEVYGKLDGGVVPAVCVQSIGRCVPLLTQDCRNVYGDYMNDNSIVIGTIFNTTGSLAGSNIPRQQAALLAAQEINSSISGGGIPGPDGGAVRPLLVVECDPTVNTLRAASHLANDLHVPAVVGPNVAEDALNITQQISAKAGMLMMTPTVPIDPVTNLNDNGLTWRDIPSDKQRGPVYADQIEALVTQLSASRSNLKLGVLVRNDALGSSALNSISNVPFGSASATIGSAGASVVSIDEYALSDTATQAMIATKYATTFQPDIVFVIAQEAVASIVIPLEQQMTTNHYSGNRPYYIATDTAKTAGWLTVPSNVPADFPTRVRGVGVTPDTASAPVFASFNAAYTGYYTTNPGTSGMGPAYDAMYSVAYAMAATRNEPVTGANVAQGLNDLLYGTAFNVGVNSASGAFQTLASVGHIALQGTFTLMHWDGNGDIIGGTLQVWCVDNSGSTSVFAPSGRNFDVTSGVFTGDYAQCASH
jgi:ABC-type branched-subunit amino acid transport system substrate-binding protein